MAFKRRERRAVDINLTPLIDIVFLLLIFFMVTTTFTRETRLLVNLPEAESASSDTTPDTIEVIVDAQGHYAVNGTRLSNSAKADLVTALTTFAGDTRDQVFLISADARAPHQAVVTVMEVAGDMAFQGVSIATQKPSATQ